MTEEIKEILERAKNLKNKCSCCEQIGENVYVSRYHEIQTQNLAEAVYLIDKLLDYITNLQQGNDRTNQYIDFYKELVDKQNKTLEDYKSRIDKAIEIYQNRNSVNIKKKRFMEDKNTSDLMYEMLQGSDKE